MENIEQEIEKLNDWNAQGRFAEVLAETNTDITLIDDNDVEENVASLYVVRGNALFGLGRFQEALEAYGKAIELDTFDVEARCNYGSTLYSLGKYVDALNACDAAIWTAENFAPSYVNAAHCLVAMKLVEEAVKSWGLSITSESYPAPSTHSLTFADESNKTRGFVAKVARGDILEKAKGADPFLYPPCLSALSRPPGIHRWMADSRKRFRFRLYWNAQNLMKIS